jgi:hypothetical protein
LRAGASVRASASTKPTLRLTQGRLCVGSVGEGRLCVTVAAISIAMNL